jgi:hypothetical protein
MARLRFPTLIQCPFLFCAKVFPFSVWALDFPTTICQGAKPGYFVARVAVAELWVSRVMIFLLVSWLIEKHRAQYAGTKSSGSADPNTIT